MASFPVFLQHNSREWPAARMIDVSAEVNRYLNDCSSDLSSLNAYPHIKQLYVALNTGLPASAAVERVFPLGGRVFSSLCNKLSAEHFEMMIFLRLAKWYRTKELFVEQTEQFRNINSDISDSGPVVSL